MLTHQDWGVTEIACHLSRSETEVREALDQLAELNLLRRSLRAPGGVRPVSPNLGFQLLLQRQQAELLAQQQQFAESQAAISKLLDEYSELRTGERHGVEYLKGIDAIQARLEELAHRSTSECLSFMPGGAQSAASLEASRPLDADLMRRGVRMLTVYLDSVRNDPATVEYAYWLHDNGGEVRTVPALPLRMVLFDREVALLPIDPDNTKKGAVQLTGPGVMSALAALFEQVWECAAPIGSSRDRDEAGLTAQEREVLRQLTSGATDEIAAKKLGIGLRTERRIVSELMGRLGARSRFEAGVLAARAGWTD
ncbi:helix-turn-helix transcriptional regulator [Streptomyces sp. L2]|uniref:helix-turn-helix domain-containing protein n=1 Tax=Streptomyces sp. L2 TaxID=2162665 RepID=UPI00101150EE|nr:helix-turn-helix transcriptional regulator [Streptomyces sp. L2]